MKMTRLLTPDQVRAPERLNLGRTKLYELIREKRLRVVRFGRALRISEAEVERFIQEAEGEAARGDGQT
jgi:excisionase family DNA binding protein